LFRVDGHCRHGGPIDAAAHLTDELEELLFRGHAAVDERPHVAVRISLGRREASIGRPLPTESEHVAEQTPEGAQELGFPRELNLRCVEGREHGRTSERGTSRDCPWVTWAEAAGPSSTPSRSTPSRPRRADGGLGGGPTSLRRVRCPSTARDESGRSLRSEEAAYLPGTPLTARGAGITLMDGTQVPGAGAERPTWRAAARDRAGISTPLVTNVWARCESCPIVRAPGGSLLGHHRWAPPRRGPRQLNRPQRWGPGRRDPPAQSPRGTCTERPPCGAERTAPMKLRLFKSKIHRATVTHADLDYEGSVTIDRDLMDRAQILPYEEVHIWNVTRGTRLSTYALEGPRGSGAVCIN